MSETRYRQGRVFNHADVFLAYVTGAESGRKHQPTDDQIARAADAYVKSVSPMVPVGEIVPAVMAEILASLVDAPGPVSACDPDFVPMVVE